MGNIGLKFCDESHIYVHEMDYFWAGGRGCHMQILYMHTMCSHTLSSYTIEIYTLF